MSTRNSDQDVLNGDTTTVISIAKSFLASLSEITALVDSAKLANNNIHEIGIYFYRVSSAIKELTRNNSGSVIKILQSLAKSADLAKGILRRLRESGQTITNHELKTLINQLEGIINQMGEDLTSIPISAFNDEKYAETAICSLSEDMRGCKFDIIQATDTNTQSQQQPPFLENHPESKSIATESELCSISTVVCTENSHVADVPEIMDALRTAKQKNIRQNRKLSSRSSESMGKVDQYVHPLYKSFCCPLTNKIMDDPVTIQSGVTYERNAIEEYFKDFRDSEEAICPITKEKLKSRAMSTNIALRSTIQEWKDRNDTAQLKVICAAFSTGSTDDVILEALKDLQNICQRNPKKIEEVCDIGVIPLLVTLLESKDRNVRCTALQMTRLLAEEHEGKELIAKTPVIASTIRQLSSSYRPIRHAALLLLIELSRSTSLSEKIGYVRGGILVLIQTKFHRSVDTFASEAADQILRNMEQCPHNIKLMAENGFLEPLLENLNEGSEDRKLQMVTYLGEIILEEDSKRYVVQRASPVFIQMLRSRKGLTRKAVFKVLSQTSSHPAGGRILIEAGIVQVIFDELFTKKLLNEQTDSIEEASAVLVNILESGVELENLVVNSEGHTMASGFFVFNIMDTLKHSKSDDLNLNLIRILNHIAKSTKSAAPVVSAVKESEASYTLVELLNSPIDEMAVAAIKLITLLSPYIGHLLIERLCKTNGQPEGLVQSPFNPGQITERQALSVCLLAKLPHQNITLNLALVTKNTVPRILHSLIEIQRATTQNRYSLIYLEGLVGVLVRFTATLYDPQILFLAIHYNFTMELTNLLTETTVEEVQRLGAVGLEKLSAQSMRLSKPPQLRRKKFLNLPEILVCGSSRKTQTRLCAVHKGVCSEQNTFCLIEAKAIERLLLCLESQNVEVAEAALSAISTLVDDEVDIDQSVNMLSEMNTIQQILKAIRHHKNERLWQKAFWVLERFLMKGGQRSLSLLSRDRLFSVSVVTAFHHGDAYMRQIAEKILRHLEKMPSLTGTFTM